MVLEFNELILISPTNLSDMAFPADKFVQAIRASRVRSVFLHAMFFHAAYGPALADGKIEQHRDFPWRACEIIRFKI